MFNDVATLIQGSQTQNNENFKSQSVIISSQNSAIEELCARMMESKAFIDENKKSLAR
jgi:hypothetical protein